MDAGLSRMFRREVDRQVEFGLTAAADLEYALECNKIDRIWFSIQALLVAAGNVSKIFWPSRPSSRARGDWLQKAFQIDDSSPLASRTIRNHFEHFDERLDDWGVSPATHMIVDTNVGPISSIVGGSATIHIRNFDPVTQTMTFRGQVFEIGRVTEALINLRQTSQRLPD